MTVPSRFTDLNVRPWILRILANYDGRFTLGEDALTKEDLPRNLWV